MSLLDYLLYDQCRSSRFGPLGPHYDNMGGGLDRREDGGPAWNARAGQESGLETGYSPYSWKQTKFDQTQIVNLRTRNNSDKKVKSKAVKINRKNSECQTDPVDGGEFDWDLSDKADIETQTRPTSPESRPRSDDATVQTDQRIVFPPDPLKRVKFELGRERGPARPNWSQTQWEALRRERGVQVVAAELGRPEYRGWRRGVRQAQQPGPAVQVGEQPRPPVPLPPDLLDTSYSAGHKSSMALERAVRAGRQQQESSDAAVQTEAAGQTALGALGPGTKAELYAAHPEFFQAVDNHVLQAVSVRWYKSVKKLVRHLQQVVATNPQYADRAELVTAR